jgi:Domain of unknown function (DUF222)
MALVNGNVFATTAQAPGFLYGDGIIPVEIVGELAKSATLQPITPPVAPESGYLPSKAMTEFARARDLTCRAPGCDRPATHCDVDRTIPFSDGGVTHPSKLKMPLPKTSPTQNLLDRHQRLGR